MPQMLLVWPQWQFKVLTGRHNPPADPWYPMLQAALPRVSQSIKQWERTFFFSLGANRRRKRWGVLKTQGAVSALLEATTRRAQALWEYWIAYHCTNRWETETLIHFDLKCNYSTQALP